MSIIKKLNLTEEQVLEIVKEWYLTKYPYIFQNEHGEDLEEVVDEQLYNFYLNKKK